MVKAFVIRVFMTYRQDGHPEVTICVGPLGIVSEFSYLRDFSFLIQPFVQVFLN